MIERITNLFSESNKKLGPVTKEKRSNTKKRDITVWKVKTHVQKHKSCFYFGQISASRKLVRNILQERAVKTRFFYAYFQRCFYKNVFLKYTAKLQENTHAEVQFQQSCKATLVKSHFCLVLSYKCSA